MKTNSGKIRQNIFLLYSYKTIGAHKDYYKAQNIQTYIAANCGFTPRVLCGLMKANNLI